MIQIPVFQRLIAVVMTTLVLSTPGIATSQQVSGNLAGITVWGTGTSSAPAETATIVLMVVNDIIYEEPMATEPDAEPDATPHADDTATPVIDALVGAGIPADDIEMIVNPYSGDYGPYGGPVTVTLRFTIDDPTTDIISGYLDAALDASRENGLYLTMMGAVYGVDDCAPLKRESRQAAIVDAREQATLQAELLGVSLGEVTASRDDPYTPAMYGNGFPTNSCTMDEAGPSVSSIYSAPPFDATVSPQVTVATHLEMTFGIEPGLSATPAP